MNIQSHYEAVLLNHAKIIDFNKLNKMIWSWFHVREQSLAKAEPSIPTPNNISHKQQATMFWLFMFFEVRPLPSGVGGLHASELTTPKTRHYNRRYQKNKKTERAAGGGKLTINAF